MYYDFHFYCYLSGLCLDQADVWSKLQQPLICSPSFSILFYNLLLICQPECLFNIKIIAALALCSFQIHHTPSCSLNTGGRINLNAFILALCCVISSDTYFISFRPLPEEDNTIIFMFHKTLKPPYSVNFSSFETL